MVSNRLAAFRADGEKTLNALNILFVYLFLRPLMYIKLSKDPKMYLLRCAAIEFRYARYNIKNKKKQVILPYPIIDIFIKSWYIVRTRRGPIMSPATKGIFDNSI
jgi:hypothetical protein